MDVLYKVLQSKMYDVLHCANKIEEFLRDNTNEIMDFMECSHRLSSVEITQLVSANVIGEIAMQSTRKLIALPYVLPLLSEQIKTRYASPSKLYFFQLLWPAKYGKYKAKFPNGLLNKLQTIYGPLYD